jgi:hypothetical protein
MIKKAYEKPETKVTRIRQAQIICLSIVDSIGLDVGENLNYSGRSDDACNAMVRRGSYNVWDDDWNK